jgi:predicted GH43/DUF377 family glycosyl hydrolase
MLSIGPEAWESSFIDPGAVIYDNGLFHSFYNGVGEWPNHARVGYATSPDGTTWQKQTADGLFSGEDHDWTGISIFVHDGAVLDNGTWALYFSTIRSSHDLSSGVIGIATAPAPTGPWTVHPDPIIEHGPEGSWDSDGTIGPTVLRVGESWWMYYDGRHGSERSIGLATSEDGYVWKKYTPDGFTEGGPLLTAGSSGDWDEGSIFDPQVVHTSEGFIMSYFSQHQTDSASIHEAGLAFSDDGLVWRKDPRGPFLNSERWGLASILLSSLVHHEDQYFFYFDGERASGGTSAFYVTHSGSLHP